MDIHTAIQVLSEQRPVKHDEYGQVRDKWRNDRNRRKSARRLLATDAQNTSQARGMRRHGDVMRRYVSGIETKA